MVKRQDGTDPDQSTWSRRSFLSLAGWGATLASLGIGTVAWGRMMYPRVLFEEPMAFKVGFPNEYAPNTVSDKWIKAYRFWLVRLENRFVALSAVCTHLGCTPLYLGAEDKFKCPCHGSGFRGIGTGDPGLAFEGPAPRALERFKIAEAEDGQILVDKSVVFRREIDDGWDKPGSYWTYQG